MGDKILRRLQEIEQIIDQDQLVQMAFDHFKKITPVGDPARWKSNPPPGYRPGTARRNTKRNQDEIHADYAYAVRLNTGWSKQAPDGMSKPTIEEIRRYIKKKLR